MVGCTLLCASDASCADAELILVEAKLVLVVIFLEFCVCKLEAGLDVELVFCVNVVVAE